MKRKDLKVGDVVAYQRSRRYDTPRRAIVVDAGEWNLDESSSSWNRSRHEVVLANGVVGTYMGNGVERVTEQNKAYRRANAVWVKIEGSRWPSGGEVVKAEDADPIIVPLTRLVGPWDEVSAARDTARKLQEQQRWETTKRLDGVRHVAITIKDSLVDELGDEVLKHLPEWVTREAKVYVDLSGVSNTSGTITLDALSKALWAAYNLGRAVTKS